MQFVFKYSIYEQLIYVQIDLVLFLFIYVQVAGGNYASDISDMMFCEPLLIYLATLLLDYKGLCKCYL